MQKRIDLTTTGTALFLALLALTLAPSLRDFLDYSPSGLAVARAEKRHPYPPHPYHTPEPTKRPRDGGGQQSQPTSTPTETPTETPTPMPTDTPTPTPTDTPTPTPTRTDTPTPTATNTSTKTPTQTPVPSVATPTSPQNPPQPASGLPCGPPPAGLLALGALSPLMWRLRHRK